MSAQNFLRSTTMLSSFVGASFIAVMAAQAADMPVKAPYAPPPSLPAVSGTNYNLSVFGGYARVSDFGAGLRASGGVLGVGGTVVTPLAYSYGLKLSGLAGIWDGDGFFSGAAHLFWRDPAIGLLGLYGSYTRTKSSVDTDIGRLGIEYQRYLGQYSVEGQIGVEGGDIDTRLYSRLGIGYYLNDNLKLTIGHRYTNHRHLLALGAESLLRTYDNSNALSGFVEGRVGSDYGMVWAGFRMYFGGGDKSLIRRHREDDPGNATTDAADDLWKRTVPSSAPTPQCPSGEVFDPEDGCVPDVT